MSNETVAILAYAGVSFVVILGGLIWQRFRRDIKRNLNIKHYGEDSGKTPHAV